MPLPQQVIEQLGREPTATPGWSSGILLFSGSILAIVLVTYLGLVFGYEPYLNAQIKTAEGQASQLGQSISASDQANLVAYYSEVANLHTLIGGHVFFSQVLTWLENNTEANVYYGNFKFTSGNQISFSAYGKTEADVNQQLEIFEGSPNVQAVSVGTIAFSPTVGMWEFDVTLTMQPSVFLWQSSTAPSAAAPALVPAAAQPVASTTASTTTP